MSFELSEYRIIIEGLRILLVDLSEIHDHIRDLCTEPPGAIHRSELASFSGDLKSSHQKIDQALSALRDRLKKDKASIEALSKCYREDHYRYPSQKKNSQVAKSTSPKSGPIYCPGCGQLADTFCECGFSESYRGVA